MYTHTQINCRISTELTFNVVHIEHSVPSCIHCIKTISRVGTNTVSCYNITNG